MLWWVREPHGSVGGVSVNADESRGTRTACGVNADEDEAQPGKSQILSRLA